MKQTIVFIGNVLCFISMLFVPACQTEPDIPMEEVTDPIAPQHILFIGNSLTYYNDGLDFHLKGFVDANVDITYQTISREARGGYTLFQHWNDTRTRNAIDEQDWDLIILQENGNLAHTMPDEVLPSIELFNTLVFGETTKLMLFMTWGYTGYDEMTSNLANVYYDAGDKIAAQVVPVGLAWRDVNEKEIPFSLLEEDGVHPSIYGTYFTAAIFYVTLYDENPVQNGYFPTEITEEDALFLRKEAWEAFQKYK